jgi:NAD+ kinase
MKVLLFGAEADRLVPHVAVFPDLDVVDAHPDVVVCYGGDGTLLAAERQFPGIPKAPIRNSRKGVRCIPHPPEKVLERLAEGRLHRNCYLKIACEIQFEDGRAALRTAPAMNEVNVHMGRINTSARFLLWIDEEPYENGLEIIGDGFIVSTPFGSTAYFKQITRGVFHTGIGLAFIHPNVHVNHVVIPEHVVIRAQVTRGPAILAEDNSPNLINLKTGDTILINKNEQPATVLTWDKLSHPSDHF